MARFTGCTGCGAEAEDACGGGSSAAGEGSGSAAGCRRTSTFLRSGWRTAQGGGRAGTFRWPTREPAGLCCSAAPVMLRRTPRACKAACAPSRHQSGPVALRKRLQRGHSSRPLPLRPPGRGAAAGVETPQPAGAWLADCCGGGSALKWRGAAAGGSGRGGGVALSRQRQPCTHCLHPSLAPGGPSTSHSRKQYPGFGEASARCLSHASEWAAEVGCVAVVAVMNDAARVREMQKEGGVTGAMSR